MSLSHPPLVVMSTLASNVNDAAVINPTNAPIIDIIAGIDAAVEVAGWLNPGLTVGEELVVRALRRRTLLSGGVDNSNQAQIILKVLTPGSLLQDLDYLGFDGATSFIFPPYSDERTFFGPSIAFFRWSGVSWLPFLTKLPQA